jgi:hypothetical protein
MRFSVVLLIVAGLALSAQAAAAAPTPASYRAQLNRLCRSYTPKLKADAQTLRAALKANHAAVFGSALADLMRLTLEQDGKIRRTPVPTALRTQMKPILGLFRTADVHVRRAAAYGSQGNVRGVLGELQQVARITPALNRRLDRAGLRDCGSNQT